MQFVELIKASAKERERDGERLCLRVGGRRLQPGRFIDPFSDGWILFFPLHSRSTLFGSGGDACRQLGQNGSISPFSFFAAAAALAWAVQAQQTNAGHTHPSALLYKSS